MYFSAQEYKWAPKNCLEDLKKFLTKGGGEERAGGVNLLWAVSHRGGVAVIRSELTHEVKPNEYSFFFLAKCVS